MDFRTIFKNIGERINAKRYLGLLPGNLPVNASHWGSSEFLHALEISLYASRAIEKRAQKVSEIEFKLYDAKGNEIEKDQRLDLLYRPNKFFTGRKFWKLYQTYYDAVGEVYILLSSERQIFEPRRITEMTMLIPTRVKKIRDKMTGEITEYEYKTDEGTYKYPPERILYSHNPDPKAPLDGISLLKTGINAIQTETQISTYHSRVLENGGKVEGVFKFKTDKLTNEQLKRVKDAYQKEYGSSKKAGLPIFLGSDADYVRTGLTPDELSFLEAKKMTLEDICILTGVPKSILASTNDVKFDNADADRAIFLRETIRPLLVDLTTVLDELLFPDKNITLSFVDPTPENIEEKRKNIETANTINALTTNEKRELLKTLGIEVDPVNEGNDILVPFSVSPLGAEPVEPTQTDSQKSVKSVAHPLKDAEFRKTYHGIQIKRLDKRESRFKKVLNEYLNEQRDRIVESLQPSKTRVFRKEGLFDDLIRLDLEVKIGKEKFLPVLKAILLEAGMDALELVGSSYNFILSAEIATWLDQKSDIFLRSINETTFEELRQEFTQSLADGETREQLISRVQGTYGTIKKSRATTIARTEVHNASQYGTMEGYKQAGMTIKIWVSVLDSATRDSHYAIDGEEKPIDATFSNGLMFPGDPRGSAAEVINCRCVI